MRGLLKWPLGDRVTERVIRLQGWSYLFVGASSLVLTVLLLVLPGLLDNDTAPVRWLVAGVLSISVLLMLCGVVPYVRSVVLSYRR
jgi:Na+/melibiose symporter-like transporter